jgi:hypothetical protein
MVVRGDFIPSSHKTKQKHLEAKEYAAAELA